MSFDNGLKCGFCGRPHFETQDSLERHVESCAPVRGHIARFGTGVDRIGRYFQCDPISGLASLHPQLTHTCPWCMAICRTQEEASQHPQSCAMRRKVQASYQSPQPYAGPSIPPVAMPPITQGGGSWQPLQRELAHQFYSNHVTAANFNHNQLLQPQLRILQPQTAPVPARQPKQSNRSPYFKPYTDEQTLMNRINESPSHFVTSILVDIARNNAEARAIPNAPVLARLLPIIKPHQHQPTASTDLQSRPVSSQLSKSATQSATTVAPAIKTKKAKKAKKPSRARFTFCEGCDRYCKHSSDDADVIYDM